MGRSGGARVFAALVLAVLPPILLLVGLLLLGDLLGAIGPIWSAILIVAGALVWAWILSVVFGRVLDEEARNMLTVAERGAGDVAGSSSPVQEQLAKLLHDRNRQLETVAAEISDIPIDDDPRRVLSAVVGFVQSLTADATWRCAVLSAADEELLPLGSYLAAGPDEPKPVPIGDLEQWVSGSISAESVRRVDGPWGAFLLINVSVPDRVRAVLYAPWEGRPEPTSAELALLSLAGQHATIALQHAMLYHRVQRQAAELNRLAAVQIDFLRGVTHDLQTPLTSISTMALEVASDATLSPGSRRDLETITHQAERLRRMVAQLLIASRLEAGAVHPAAEVFSVQPIIERTWAALRADRPFEMTATGVPHLVVADPDRFEQVLWAVLDNAVKYSPVGSAIRVSTEPRDGELNVDIADDGSGMDPETLARAFDQFYRSPRARSIAPNGSGIGLYAARGLMRAMGGEIQLTSSLGQGTTVRLRLAAERADAAE